MNEQLKKPEVVREISHAGERIETGPTQIGQDWPGLFIRADNAFSWALDLKAAIKLIENDEVNDAWKELLCASLKGMVEHLESCFIEVKGADQEMGMPAKDPNREPKTEFEEEYMYAKSFVIKTRRTKISEIQGHLRIGYHGASRIVEALEERGVVSTMKAHGKREVLE